MADMRIDYDLTVAKAKRIKELSGDMLTIISKLKGHEAEIQQYWRGEASNQYIDECEKLISYLIKLDLKISEFGDSIIKIANIIKTADENSRKMASNLTTGY
ncbi:MAG: WXG100 family type VII secretion target [Lachnospirales bacterium]